MKHTPKVLLIMGSVRTSRICPRVTEWVAGIGRSCNDFNYEIIDLTDWPLPMDDEPGIPAMGSYLHPHTRAWSEKVASAEAVVFVTPQYNWGYPAVLKNALDHLYKEWRDKPAAIVSYGGHGGGKCSGQLRQVAEALKMRLVPTSPGITLSDDVIRHGASIDPDQDFVAHVEAIQQAFNELAVEVELANGA
jgi:NAD(P)H-dependent FMN reductase